MEWGPALSALAETRPPTGYALSQLARAQVPALVSELGRWFPDLRVSGERCHLDPRFYEEHAALAGETADRSVLPLVALRNDALAGVITLERDVSTRTVTCRVGAIAPAHRGPALALLGPMLLERVARAVGAELALYHATLKSRHQQVLAERSRFALVGIVPACDHGYTERGTVKRVYEALYAKVLVDESRVAQPDDDALTARTRAVWRALFPEPTGR